MAKMLNAGRGEVKSPAVDDDDDVWDDTLLIKAYESSIKMAKEDVAKRVAALTNNKHGSGGADVDSEQSVVTEQIYAQQTVYKVGDYVRATYDDGIDYEAKILYINHNDNTCLLRYIGYENEQEARLCDLVPSWGKKARRLQFTGAKQTTPSDTDSSMKSSNSKKTQWTSIEPPPPPPMPPMPPMLLHRTNFGSAAESEHFSAMLMSWYMSGYYTGVYQGMRMGSDKSSPKK